MKTTFTTVLLLTITVYLSCGLEGKKEKKSTDFSREHTDVLQQDLPKKNIYYRFPSAKEMLSYIKTEELNYRTGIVNPVNNLDNYYSTKAKTLNLGVYITDLSYMILFDRTQNIERYFNVIFNLTNDLRIKIPDEEELIEQISKNMDDSEKLLQIAEEYQTKIIDHLLNTGQEKTLAVITTGSYIEGLYISTKLLSNSDTQEKTLKKIADQKHAFRNLTKFSQSFEKDINTKAALVYLKDINSFFNSLPVIKEETEVKKDESNLLLIEGGKKSEITPENFNELKSIVSRIRTEIVEN
ncbi:MAG: hypothetical protein ACLFNL_04445 [Bacteroidales bacterium]